MQITDIHVKLRTQKNSQDVSKVKAYISIVLDNQLVINDIKVIEDSNNKLCLLMPRRKNTATYKLYDIVHIVNQESKDQFEEEILNAYNEWLEGCEE